MAEEQRFQRHFDIVTSTLSNTTFQIFSVPIFDLHCRCIEYVQDSKGFRLFRLYASGKTEALCHIEEDVGAVVHTAE
jgi:hypothetical protein